MKKTISAISTRTDAEWPHDHPLRAVAPVMSNEEIAHSGTYLVCTIVGEPRLPPAADDGDVVTECDLCPRDIVHRASAPKNLTPICWRCWQALSEHGK